MEVILKMIAFFRRQARRRLFQRKGERDRREGPAHINLGREPVHDPRELFLEIIGEERRLGHSRAMNAD